jgi:hypothetical protein
MLEDGQELAVVSRSLGHDDHPSDAERAAARMDRFLTTRTG